MTLRGSVLADIATHPGARISDIARRLAVDLHIVRYHLDRLKKDGVIAYDGPKHQAAWHIREVVS